MASEADRQKILAGISDKQVLDLEQAAIRIPSTTFEEGAIADMFASHMSGLGLDVEMMDVTHWAKPGKTTRQPIGRLRGTGGGPSLAKKGLRTDLAINMEHSANTIANVCVAY